MPAPWEQNPLDTGPGPVDQVDPWEQFIMQDPRAQPQDVVLTPEETMAGQDFPPPAPSEPYQYPSAQEMFGQPPPQEPHPLAPPQIGPATRLAVSALQTPTAVPQAESPEQAMEQQKGAMAEKSDIERRRADMEALGRKEAADIAIQRQKEEEAAQEADWKYAETERKGMQQESMRLRDVQVDPNRIFHANDTWQNLALIASAFAGGFLAPMQGGRNPAIEAIQDMIDRDIKAQEANIATQGRNLEFRRGLYTDFLAATNDRIKSRALATAKYYDMLIEKTKAEASQFDSDIIKAEYEAKIAAFEEAKQRSFLKAEFDKREESRSNRRLQVEEYNAQTSKYSAETSRKQVGLGYAQLGFEKAKWTDQLRFNYDELMAKGQSEKAKALADAGKNAVVFASDPSKGPEGIYRAATPEESAKINDKLALATSLTQDIQRLRELSEKTQGFKVSKLSDEYREAESLTKIITNKIAVAEGQGQIGMGERPHFEKIVGDPAAWFGSFERSRLKAVEDTLERDANAQLSRTFRIDENGGVQQWKGHWKAPALNPPGFNPGGRVGTPSTSEPPPPQSRFDEEQASRANAYYNKGEDFDTALRRSEGRQAKKQQLLEKGYSEDQAEKFLKERGF